MAKKRPVGRPRKYKTRKEWLEARKRWARAWRLANPERWREIQRKADAKRRGKGRGRPLIEVLT